MIKEFWPWFFSSPVGRQTGWKLLLTPWLLIDFLVSAFLTRFLVIDGFDFASKALFPAASILVSMAIAWTARASTILNDKTFQAAVVDESRPIEDYVYGYQLSLGIMITSVVYMSVMAAGGLNFSIISPEFSRTVSTVVLFVLLSWSIRECWRVINFSNLLGILHSHVQKR